MKNRLSQLAAASSALLLAACGAASSDANGGAPVDAAASATAVTTGEGESQGDALVAGTGYNATAQVPCGGYKGAAAGLCDAGVTRNGADGITVEVTLGDGTERLIFFNPDGSFLTFSTAQADGTAAMAISSEKKGDVTIARLGSETYEIPDAFVVGG